MSEQDKAGLMPPTAPSEAEEQQGSQEIHAALGEAESTITKRISGGEDSLRGWKRSREIVEEFKPVPWFIWRLANFVFGTPGQINVIPEGMVLGLRRMLFAAAGDRILGGGKPVNNVKVALSILRSDVIAAVSVIHAICRRLAGKELERIWKPILDDALLRAQIGFFVGERCYDFGRGRGMLAGFSGRAGLAVMLATGDSKQATSALEQLAGGADISAAGMDLYHCDPLQVSAMLLSAGGCGRDAAYGTASFSSSLALEDLKDPNERLWCGAFSLIELVRTGRTGEVPPTAWNLLGFESEQKREELCEMVKLLVREGTTWTWMS